MPDDEGDFAMVALVVVVEEGTAAVPPTDLFLEEERVRVDIII